MIYQISFVRFDDWNEGLFEPEPLVDPVVVDGQDDLVVALQQQLRLLVRDDAVAFKVKGKGCDRQFG